MIPLLILTLSALAVDLRQTATVYGFTWVAATEHCAGGYWYKEHVRAYSLNSAGKHSLALVMDSRTVRTADRIVQDVWALQEAMTTAGCKTKYQGPTSNMVSFFCAEVPGAVTLLQLNSDPSSPPPGDFLMLGLSLPLRPAVGGCPAE